MRSPNWIRVAALLSAALFVGAEAAPPSTDAGRRDSQRGGEPGLGNGSMDIHEDFGNGSVEISWTPPTTRNDGSTLTDLAGYRIYYGHKPGDYSEMVEVGSGVTSHIIERLGKGQWYFTLTALSSRGLESGFSYEGAKAIEY